MDISKTTTQFRPISISNTFYKILAKLLVNRLLPIIERTIYPTQSVFVPHRAIHNNISPAHEMMNKFYHFKGRNGYVVVKLDMRKAYDRIKWDFILQCLNQLEFHPVWINWIKECVSIVSYSVLVNNEPMNFLNLLVGYVKVILYYHIYLLFTWM